MKLLAAILLAIGLFVPCIAGCSRSYRFVGVVVDGQGNGIVDADVIVYPHHQKHPESLAGEKTKQDGSFETTWCCNPNEKLFRMIVSKDGYDTDKRTVLADEDSIRIVLSVASNKVE